MQLSFAFRNQHAYRLAPRDSKDTADRTEGQVLQLMVWQFFDQQPQRFDSLFSDTEEVFDNTRIQELDFASHASAVQSPRLILQPLARTGCVRAHVKSVRVAVGQY